MKNDYVQNAKKVTKINLRTICKPHAYLQTIQKTPVKFQKDRPKTVGGVAHTKHLLLEGDRTTEARKAKYYVPSLFFEKAGAIKGLSCILTWSRDRSPNGSFLL